MLQKQLCLVTAPELRSSVTQEPRNGGLSVLGMLDPVITLQLSGEIKPSPPGSPGEGLKSPARCLSSQEKDDHGCPLPAASEEVVSVRDAQGLFCRSGFEGQSWCWMGHWLSIGLSSLSCCAVVWGRPLGG